MMDTSSTSDRSFVGHVRSDPTSSSTSRGNGKTYPGCPGISPLASRQLAVQQAWDGAPSRLYYILIA